jgi:Flp pilus assembly protein TadD
LSSAEPDRSSRGNQLGEFAEAETRCRAAVAFQPYMYNAHKSLGVALAGQGRFAAAARSLLEAAQRAVCDGRALAHLEELLAARPEVGREHPEILAAVQAPNDRPAASGARPM